MKYFNLTTDDETSTNDSFQASNILTKAVELSRDFDPAVPTGRLFV